MDFSQYRNKILLGENVISEGEGGFKHNVAVMPVDMALEYALAEYEKAGKNLSDDLPNFESNYKMLQKKCKAALDVPRIEMPVIEPEDMKKFQDNLTKGRVDIFRPYAKGTEFFPTNLKGGKEGKEWLELGVKDGDPKDDVIKAKRGSIAAKDLIPTQSQIWLEKLVANTIKFGPAEKGGFITKQTIIVSKEGYILDGHHRFGQIMLADPAIKIDAIFVPLDIRMLLKLGRTYGNAVGRKQKQ